jgi:hypothetical protein
VKNLYVHRNILAEASCEMSYRGNNIHRLYEQIRSIVHNSNQDEEMCVRVLADLECGVIKIYDQYTNSLKRAISGLYDVLELSYLLKSIIPIGQCFTMLLKY